MNGDRDQRALEAAGRITCGNCGADLGPDSVVAALTDTMDQLAAERALREAAERDAKNAADMMLLANAEAVRYMRERDTARAEGFDAGVKLVRCPERAGGHEWDGDGQCKLCGRYATDLIDAAMRAAAGRGKETTT